MQTAARRKFPLKRVIALAVSVGLLVVLLRSVGREALARVFASIDLWWYGIALAFFVPQIGAIAHRWSLIAEPLARLHPRESRRQVLASNCLNLVLPSKLGDLAKGVFLYRQGRCRLDEGFQIVVFEKLLDLAALSAWMLIGWLFAPVATWWAAAFLALGAAVIATVAVVYFIPRGRSILMPFLPAVLTKGRVGEWLAAGPRVMALVHADRGRRTRIVAWSMAIWLLHIAQTWCFMAAVSAGVSPGEVLARMPMAIFAGLMPLSIAGFGVRDWAIVTLFASTATSREALVGAGLLVSLRYVIPAAAGLPFMARSLETTRDAQQAASPAHPQRPQASRAVSS